MRTGGVFRPVVRRRGQGRYERRGVAAVATAVALVLLLGCAALAIDGGRLMLARTQLQAAADSAAFSAASAMLIDANQKNDYLAVLSEGYGRATDVSQRHTCLGADVNLAQANVLFGRIDNPQNKYEVLDTATTNYNAVRVIAQRTQNSVNGPVGLILAMIWGNETADVGADATVVIDDRMSGFKPKFDTLLPFTIHINDYNDQVQSGSDSYGWEPVDGEVTTGGDDIPEVKLYPDKQKSTGKKGSGDEESDGGGNFGTLNIGVGNQGNPYLRGQIENGVTSEDLENEIGTSEVTFYDDDGDAKVYFITGNPGISAGIESSIESRVGDVVGFFLHSDVEKDGSNATYTIVAIRFGRLMDVQLSGKDKYLYVQPVLFAGPEVLTDEDAPNTGLRASRMYLAR